MVLTPDILARIRSYPLVDLPAKFIRERAYFRWLAGSGDGALGDWLAAEEEHLALWAERALILVCAGSVAPQTIEESYDIVFSWNETHGRRRLGTRDPRFCSICRKGKRDGASFKAEAHVLPELLGSSQLTTYDECKPCNHDAGRLFENDLGNMLTPDRAVLGMRGKAGPIALDFKRDGTFVGHKEGRLIVATREGSRNIRSEITSDRIHLEVFRSSYRPSRIVKVLAKIAWHTLESSSRSESDRLRQYIRGEINWERSEFYRVPLPGLRRVAVGVWKRRPAAPASLPLLVMLVSTANTILVWNSPDLESGRYLEPVFPPLLRLPDGAEPTIFQIATEGDAAAPPSMQSFRFRHRGVYRSGTHLPTHVCIESIDDRGPFSVTAFLTAPRSATAGAKSITQILDGGELIGRFEFDHRPDTGRTDFRYGFEVAPRAGMDLVPTLRLLAAIARGADVSTHTLDDDRRAVMPPLRGASDAMDLRLLEDGVRIAERLAVIRERTGAELKFPPSLDDEEREYIAILAEGLRAGRVGKHTPETESEVLMPKAMALAFATSPGLAADVTAPCLATWVLGGVQVNPGPVRVVMEDSVLAEDASELRKRVMTWPDAGNGNVRIRYASLCFEFVDHLPSDEHGREPGRPPGTGATDTAVTDCSRLSVEPSVPILGGTRD